MVNTKLINRENGGRETINSMDRMLKRGRSIIIYPEGLEVLNLVVLKL